MTTATVLTWGCTHNQKDSQLIEFQLKQGGYTLLQEQDLDDADVVVLNTCTVKTPTENKIIHVLDELTARKQKVVVTGCLSQAEPDFLQERYPEITLLGVNAANYILPVLNNVQDSSSLIPIMETMNQRGMKDNQKHWIDKPSMPSTQWNEYLNIVQINEGCLNFCTFCSTKKARGHLRSYSKRSIINAIREVVTPEVWLTSQDTACWGFDINDTLSSLMSEISQIQRKFWVRIGMGNPNNYIKILDSVIEAYKSDKVYKFLHLPVQAGSNTVLKHMRRGYTVEEYEYIVERFRNEIPNITLSTDVICGYPTETADDFLATLATIKRTRPAITNISRYWERRGTEAANLPQLSFNERKRRSKRLTKLCHIIQKEDNKTWIGWTGEVYLAEEGVKGGIQARNIFYKPIIVDLPVEKVGTWERVEITSSTTTYLKGKVIN